MDKVTCGSCGAESVLEPIRGGDWCLRCGAPLGQPAETAAEPEPVAVGADCSAE